MTNPPTEVHYRLSEDDAALAARLYGWPTRRIKWLIAVLLVLAPAAVALLVWLAEPRRAAGDRWLHALAPAVLTLVGAVIGGAAMPYVVQPWLARRAYRRHKLMHEAFALSVTDERLHLRSASGESKAHWSQMCQWRQDRDNILIYPAPNMYIVVPRRLAAQGLDLDRLTQLLTQHVGAAA